VAVISPEKCCQTFLSIWGRKKKLRILVKKLSETAKLPTRATAEAAGFDLYVDLNGLSSVEIPPHTSAMLSTGIAMVIPNGYFGGIFARSGLASKEGLRPPNCVGVIDSDYRGNIGVGLYNDSDETRTINHGQRVAQLIIIPCPDVTLDETEELPETERGAGGFGSTGR
jgi:dUTP pyrophosphatase